MFVLSLLDVDVGVDVDVSPLWLLRVVVCLGIVLGVFDGLEFIISLEWIALRFIAHNVVFQNWGYGVSQRCM